MAKSGFAKRELKSDKPLGQQLRAVRRTAQLNLDEVASLTKIRKEFLSALENGKYDIFPADVYARGFLENYADFLGFPPDEVLLQYKRERGLSGEKKTVARMPTPKTEPTRLTITPKTLWAAVGAMSLLVAVGYIVAQVGGFASPPNLELYKPAVSEVLTSETVEVSGKTDPGAELAINSQPVPTNPDGGFDEQVRLPSGASTIKVSAKNKRGQERVITRSIVVQTKATPTPKLTRGPSALLFTVKIGPDSAYVTIVVDDKTVFEGVLSPKTEQSFLASRRILLTTSNAGSTRVLLNGVDQGTVGDDGQYRQGIEYLVPTPKPTPSKKPSSG